MNIFLIVVTILLTQFTFANESEFGQYRYSQYLGIQQQLQNQRMNAIRRQRMHNQNPMRNIRYPNANNPYPNIQRSSYQHITPRQRYSARYYQSL